MDELAVVIITRNLEWNIGRILDSVFAELPDPNQVVVVDSASTDRTVELALAYPRDIIVCRLADDQRLTAAAGRAVGQEVTESEFVLFLDGDVELLPGFFERALEVIQSDPQIGVIGGSLINVGVDEYPALDELPLVSGPGIVDVPHANGAGALYRRSALEATGGFDPRVFSDEEPALAVKLRHAGYRVVRIEHSSVLHHTDPIDDVTTLIKRRGRGLWIGHGQNIRRFIGTGMLRDYLRERGHGLAPAGTVLALLAAVVAALATGSAWWLVAVLILGGLLFVALAILKRSPERALFTVVKRFLILEGTVRGLLDSSPVNDRHVEYEVIR